MRKQNENMAGIHHLTTLGEGEQQSSSIAIQLFESLFLVTAIGKPIIVQLRKIQSASEDVKTSRTLLADVAALIDRDDMRKKERIISDVEYFIRILIQDLNRTRSNPYTNIIYGSQHQRSVTISPDNSTVTSSLKDLCDVCVTLKGVIESCVSLKSSNKADSAKESHMVPLPGPANLASSVVPELQSNGLPTYDPQQLLHHRRISRMQYPSRNNLRISEDIIPQTKSFQEGVTKHQTLVLECHPDISELSAGSPTGPNGLSEYHRLRPNSLMAHELEGCSPYSDRAEKTDLCSATLGSNSTTEQVSRSDESDPRINRLVYRPGTLQMDSNGPQQVYVPFIRTEPPLRPSQNSYLAYRKPLISLSNDVSAPEQQTMNASSGLHLASASATVSIPRKPVTNHTVPVLTECRTKTLHALSDEPSLYYHQQQPHDTNVVTPPFLYPRVQSDSLESSVLHSPGLSTVPSGSPVSQPDPLTPSSHSTSTLVEDPQQRSLHNDTEIPLNRPVRKRNNWLLHQLDKASNLPSRVTG